MSVLNDVGPVLVAAGAGTWLCGWIGGLATLRWKGRTPRRGFVLMLRLRIAGVVLALVGALLEVIARI